MRPKVFTIDKFDDVLRWLDYIKRYLKPDKKYVLEVKQYRPKRSNDANAYAWVLITKIAEVLGTSKDEVYEDMLARYGVTEVDENGVAQMFYVLPQIDPKGFVKHSAFVETDYQKGMDVYRVIKGSSEYNSSEMAKFIYGIVEDCKELDIDTATPEELARMVEY